MSSVALYGDGSFEDQIRELVDYLARGLAEEPRIAFIRPFSEGLAVKDSEKPLTEDEERRRKILDLVLAEVKSLGQGTEREQEAFFNLLFSQTLSTFPDPISLSERLTSLTSTITSTPDPSSIKYRILGNFFNSLPISSPHRHRLYLSLYDFAEAQKELSVLQISKPSVESWLKEWDIDNAQKSELLKKIADSLGKEGKAEEAFDFYTTRATSYPSPSASADAIAGALHLPIAYDFNSLLEHSAFSQSSQTPLFSLLKVVAHGDLNAYRQWESQNGSTISEAGLDAQKIERNLRFLTLTNLTTPNIGKSVSYGQIASTLQVDEKDVEVWVIDAIRSKIVTGKLVQPTKTFFITSSITRGAVSSPHWETLERKLVSWRAGLVGVLDVLRGTRASASTSSDERDGAKVHGDLLASSSQNTVAAA